MGTHSNWHEQVLEALKQGHLTTMITFDNTQYMVTLQPITDEQPPTAVGICQRCGQLVLRAVGNRWYHKNARDGSHAALVEGWTPTDPTKAHQHARCICGVNLTWLVGEQRWEHTRGKAEGHVATSTTAQPLPAAATPVQEE